LLNDYGYGYVFNNPSSVCVNSFICQFKNRLIDTFKQEWFGTLSNSPVLDMYRVFKPTIVYESYLDLLPRSLRIQFVKLRISVHSLRIQTGRYGRNNIPRNERYCVCCNSRDIEDEFHFVCICPCFSVLRQKYLKRYLYVNPSVFKYHQLLTSSEKKRTCQVV